MTLRSQIVKLCLLVFSIDAYAASEKSLWQKSGLDSLVGRSVLLEARRCEQSPHEAAACLKAVHALTTYSNPTLKWTLDQQAPSQTLRSFGPIHIYDSGQKSIEKDREKEMLMIEQFAATQFENIYDTLPFILVWAYEELVPTGKEAYATSILLNCYYRHARDVYTHIALNESFKSDTNRSGQEFVGIGVFLEELDSGLLVMDILPDSPAERAGLRMGDRIVKVDQTEIESAGKTALSNALMGEENSNVMVSVIRGQASLRLLANRRKLILNFVDTRTIDTSAGKIAHISIATFYSGHICDQVAQAIQHANANQYRGIILDVRNNGGGIVQQATCVADLFLGKNLPLLHYTKAHPSSDSLPPESSRYDQLTKLPVVVLQNEASASASEILGVILQDYERAPVVGTLGYGKGLVQSETPWINKEPVANKFGIGGIDFFYTTHFYRAPVSKRFLQHSGLEPDYRVRADNPNILRELNNAGSPQPPERNIGQAPSHDPLIDRCMSNPTRGGQSNAFVAKAIQYFDCVGTKS